MTIATKEEFELLQRECQTYITSGLLPDSITKGVHPRVALARAILIVSKGRELGLPPLYSLSSINIIKGKTCLSAEVMLALIYQRYPEAEVNFLTPPEKAHLECVISMRRPKQEKPSIFRFSIDDAKTAGLITAGSSWEKYPQAMLRARAISMGARAVFPDAIMGSYTPEEIVSSIEGIPIEEEVGESNSETRNLEEKKKETEKKSENDVSPKERLIKAFLKYNITSDRLEEFLEKKIDDIDEADMSRLRKVYAQLLMGADPKEFFL